MTPSPNFDYSGRSINNNGNNSSSIYDLSGKTDYHTENQNTYFSLCKNLVKQNMEAVPQRCSSKKVFCKYASNFRKNTHADLLCNFIEIIPLHGSLKHLNTSGGLLL